MTTFWGGGSPEIYLEKMNGVSKSLAKFSRRC